MGRDTRSPQPINFLVWAGPILSILEASQLEGVLG